jgi:hypothetical protein
MTEKRSTSSELGESVGSHIGTLARHTRDMFAELSCAGFVRLLEQRRKDLSPKQIEFEGHAFAAALAFALHQVDNPFAEDVKDYPAGASVH